MKKRNDPYLELLDKEDEGGMGLEAVGEVEAPVEEADGAIIASDGDPPPPARAAQDLAGDLVGDRGLPGGLLLEELELPLLVHLQTRSEERIWINLTLETELALVGEDVTRGRRDKTCNRKRRSISIKIRYFNQRKETHRHGLLRLIAPGVDKVRGEARGMEEFGKAAGEDSGGSGLGGEEELSPRDGIRIRVLGGEAEAAGFSEEGGEGEGQKGKEGKAFKREVDVDAFKRRWGGEWLEKWRTLGKRRSGRWMGLVAISFGWERGAGGGDVGSVGWESGGEGMRLRRGLEDWTPTTLGSAVKGHWEY
ncbi:hypothetical protein COCNU_12G000750 [Cocos nucifera]|uniref:Uncharacterized protein n=1 Tax=Cocos nucifera TaxID=13894 RepID=A0A8K0NA93_COCNU|nr:hypothetical protein COCNU_12G000750 [Cocos nucifera]